MTGSPPKARHLEAAILQAKAPLHPAGRQRATHVEAAIGAAQRKARGAGSPPLGPGPAVPHRPGRVVQRAYEKPSNIETSFTTEHGSQYEVGGGSGLTRHRYYGGISESSTKTVLYGDAETTEACLKARDRCDTYTVKPHKFGTWLITFYWHGSVVYQGKLYQWPQPGLYPVDMVLKESGRMGSDDRFHVGDRIQ